MLFPFSVVSRMTIQSFLPCACHDASPVLWKICTTSLLSSLCAEILFLDDEHTGTPTDLTSFLTKAACVGMREGCA